MKTKIYFLLFMLIFINKKAQVGIKTENPKTTLDVNGNASIREVPETGSIDGYKVMVLNSNTAEVSQIDANNLQEDIIKASYAAKKDGGISSLGVSLFSSWKQINFMDFDRTLGSPQLFSNSDHSYTVPSTGVYVVSYYFRYDSGLQATVLSGSPGMGIIKKTNNVFTILDSRAFNGINAGVLSVTISEATINALYSLQAGEKLFFGISNSGALNVSLLDSSSASFYVYKISD